jgi:SET domain-containing protein
MTKKQVIKHFKNDVYCRLKPSKISGVGVFAIRKIPAGIDPFREEKEQDYIPISEKELKGIQPNVLRLIKDLFVLREGKYWIPERGANTLPITHFLNHSKNPNLTIDKDGTVITTKRKINEGEELTIDYRTFDEDMALLEAFTDPKI